MCIYDDITNDIGKYFLTKINIVQVNKYFKISII